MSIFGWDYPPGCSSTPYDDEENISPMRENLWELLEGGDVPYYLIELVDKIIQELEHQIDIEKDRAYEQSIKYESMLTID